MENLLPAAIFAIQMTPSTEPPSPTACTFLGRLTRITISGRDFRAPRIARNTDPGVSTLLTGRRLCSLTNHRTCAASPPVVFTARPQSIACLALSIPLGIGGRCTIARPIRRCARSLCTRHAQKDSANERLPMVHASHFIGIETLNL